MNLQTRGNYTVPISDLYRTFKLTKRDYKLSKTEKNGINEIIFFSAKCSV